MLKSKLRKVTVILTIIMLMTLTLGLVAACGENPSDSVTSYKVTFWYYRDYNGNGKRGKENRELYPCG